MASLSSIGHSVANVARAVVQACGNLMGKVVELGKKPFGSPSAAKTPSEDFPVTTILDDRDVKNPDITGDVIEDYGGLNQTDGAAALSSSKKTKDALLGGLETKRQIGGGENFSDDQISQIKSSASSKADSVIEARIKSGEVPSREELTVIIGKALFEAMLELPENKGLTKHQKEGAWAEFNDSVDMNAQKRERNPQWSIPELMGIPRMQDHIDEHNTSVLLDKATYPVMRDVREAKEEDRPAIKGGQNGMIGQYVSMIRSARSDDPDVASIDKVMGPKLMGSLGAEMIRAEDAQEMTDEQFSALTDLYKDIYNSTETHTEEETAFFNQLAFHPRARVS